MRKVLAATVAGLTLAFGLALTSAPASAATGDTVTVVAKVKDTPDDGCPAWARDTFTRTLTITKGDGSYSVDLIDKGTFVTKDGVPGTILGEGKFTVNGTLKDQAGLDAVKATVNNSQYKCKADVPAERTTGQWPLRYFEAGATTGGITDWKWTYKTCAETRVETPNAAAGEITGKLCEVTPKKPTYTEPTCEAAGVVTPATTKGVEYAKSEADGKVVVTATAKGGYALKKDAEASWTFPVAKKTGDACLTEVTLAEPKVIANCDGLWYTTPNAKEATYKVTSSGSGWFVLKATLKEGYKLKAGTASEWKLTYVAPKSCPSTKPDPTPSQTQEPGAGGGSNETPTQQPSQASGELPVTGESGGVAKLVSMLSVGGILISIGGLMFMCARRRRDAGTVESA